MNSRLYLPSRSVQAIENSQVLRSAANRKWEELRKLSWSPAWQQTWMEYQVLENFRHAAMQQSFQYAEEDNAKWKAEMAAMQAQHEAEMAALEHQARTADWNLEIDMMRQVTEVSKK